MATKAMNMANDQQTGELQASSEKEESNCDDDRNNNAQDKAIPKLSILKINESFSKIEKPEKKDSAKASQLREEPLMNSDLKDDELKIPTSKNLTLLNDRKSEELKSPFSIFHQSRHYSGSSRGSAVLPLLTSEPVKDEAGNEFTDYFSMSMTGTEGSKTLVHGSGGSGGGGTSKPDSENAKSALSEHLAAMSSKSVTSSSATDLFGSGHLPSLLDMENITKNRPKSAANPGASQAGPVKPRCTPAREAVDPAKYFTLTDEPDGTKYACSKCGNVYKWRKSLNKHWKEKHDGEIPNLHARPPPSLLQRERFLNPLRGPQKHSVFHQPGFHGSGSKSTTAPVLSPPRLSSMHAGKSSSSHGMSPYLFGKFPIKDDGKEAGKGAVHQVEEPATAVVRPSRSNHSPNAPHRWTNWLSSTSGRPILDLPSPQKLKIPTVESIKSAHDHTQPRDGFSQMFTAIQGHHTLRGGPLDLSGTLVSRSSADDDNVLDLSRKGGSDVLSSSKNDCAAIVQDEPLDFSTKSHGKHLGYQKHGCTTPSDSSLSASWFPLTDKKDSVLPKVMDYSDIGLESGKGSLFLVNDYDRPGQVFCACCKLPCKTVADLNLHFARNHTSALYEASVDVSGGGSGSGSSANQLLKHLAWESAKKTLACIVCGMSVQWSWMLARHFEQVHATIQPNPYKKTTSSSSSSSSSSAASSAGVTGTSHLDTGANPAALVPATHRCETCPFVTDSVTEFSRHQLKHSLVKEKKKNNRQEALNHHSGYPLTSDDDQTKDPVVNRCPSGAAFNQFEDEIIDLEGESTAIVIPQAPEETYLGGGGARYRNEGSGPDDSPFESGIVISGENTAIVIPQAPEDASSLSSSALYSTPSGSKVSRSKKDPGPTTESLLPFKCELCEYRARWPSEMMQHMKNHSDEKPYQCPQCSYRSKWKWDVVKHLKRCGGGGSVKDVIDTTMRRKSFVKSLLIDHPHSLQSSYDGGVHAYGGSMSYPGYFDQSNPSSKLHDMLLKGPPNVTVYSGMNESNGSPEEEPDGGYENCDDSEEEEEEEDTVSEDLSLGRSEQGGNEAGGQSGGHGCAQCPFVGHSPAELKRHLRVHSDEKPYCCQTCSYSSKWKCDLKKHLKAYDHVSGVPLSYGGHGKKPVQAWSQVVREMSRVEFEESDLKLLLQGGCHGKRDPGLDRPLSRDGGNLFGGITSGGRLRCRQCEFEAIDITSFLQHKKMHSSSSEVRKRDGVAVKRKSPLPSHHHRRKSFKQTRVLPTETGGRGELSEKGGNVKIIDLADPEERRVETNRFWESLGLQSISSAKHKRQSSTGESDDTCDDPDSSDPEPELRYGSSSRCADLSRAGEFVKQFSLTSSNSYESNSDIEIETLEANEYSNCPGGGKGEMELEEVEKYSAGNHPKETKTSAIKSPFQMVRRGLRQGVTTTEAEDAAGMSKRKRKLRTCEKCGYITDNLTTLQRHAAKHGSGGRHRCWMCDYSVDRQHVLEYHVKIVHKGADRSTETKPEEPNQKPATPNRDKVSAEENFPEKSVNGNSVFERGSFGGKRKIVCTTSVIMVRGHEMEMIQKGNKTWYNCIKCHFVSSNITNAVNHAKQHGANKKYRCRHCDYSLDRKSSIANHMYSQHSQPNAFQFEIGTDADLLKPGQWMEGLRQGKIQRLRYSLLDQMGSHWKKRTCVRCGFSSINPGRMSVHRLTHGRLDKEYGCKTCAYRTTSYRLLARHVTSHGSTENRSRGIDLSVVHCGNTTSVEMERCEDDVNAPKTSGLETSDGSGKVADEKIRKPKKIRCPFCPFASFSALKSVVHSKHHNSLKKLACGECSFRADVRNVLLHHKKLHR